MKHVLLSKEALVKTSTWLRTAQ